MDNSISDACRAGVIAVCDAAGGQSALGRLLGLSQSTVSGWVERGKVPAERVLDAERVTQVPCWKIRPDLYRAPSGGASLPQPGTSRNFG